MTPWEAARISLRKDFHVEVWPELRGATEGEIVRDCEEIKAQVKRHVDGYERHGVIINWTSVTLCPFCRCRWEEEPACCTKAIDLWESTPGLPSTA